MNESKSKVEVEESVTIGCPSLGLPRIPSGADGVEPLVRTDYESVIADVFHKCNEAFIHAPQQREARTGYFKVVVGDLAAALASVVPGEKVNESKTKVEVEERKEKSLDLHDVRGCVAKTPETVVMNFTLPSGRLISAEIHEESTTSVAEAALFDGNNIVCRMRFFNQYQGRNWMYPIVRRACNGVVSKAGKTCRNRNNRKNKVEVEG